MYVFGRLLVVVLVLVLALSKPARADVFPLRIEQNLPLVDVRIGASRPLRFILDTGASATVISSHAAQELNLIPGSKVAATAQGGEVEARPIAGVQLRLGATSIAPKQIFAIDLSNLSAGLGVPIDGVLGYEVFENRIVRIDYRTAKLEFLDKRGVSKGTKLRIDVRGNTPFVRGIVIENQRHIPASLLIDTGATGALILNATFVRTHPSLVPPNTLSLTSGALLPGQFHSRVGRVSAFALADFKFSNPVVNFSSNAAADDAVAGDDGIIGGELLRRFTVTLDYSNGEMILTPNAAIGESFLFDASGISFASRGPAFAQIYVRSVIPNSPADDANVAPGDVLEEFDGQKGGALGLGALRAALRTPGVHKIRLSRDGRIYGVILRTKPLI